MGADNRPPVPEYGDVVHPHQQRDHADDDPLNSR